jgi:hypothetical protein
VIEHLFVVRIIGHANAAIVRWGEVEFDAPLGALLLPAEKGSGDG